MQKIVLATHNRHKIEEMLQILFDYPFEWRNLNDFPATEVPLENGSTYLENALIKARDACRQTQLPCLADDSGLEVEALEGAPGLHSARFGGPETTHAQKIQLLLNQLNQLGSGMGAADRRARFRCVIALVHPDGREWSSEATCPGLIAAAPRGEHGFGYDPVFWLPQYCKTMAELSAPTKNRISHRALALFELWEQIYRGVTNYPQL